MIKRIIQMNAVGPECFVWLQFWCCSSWYSIGKNLRHKSSKNSQVPLFNPMHCAFRSCVVKKTVLSQRLVRKMIKDQWELNVCSKLGTMQAKKLEIWDFKKHYLNPGIILAASCEFLKHWPTQYFIVSSLVFTK